VVIIKSLTLIGVLEIREWSSISFTTCHSSLPR
jgi:hypothetical protein